MHDKHHLIEDKSPLLFSLLILMAGFIYCYVRGLSLIHSIFLILLIMLFLCLLYLTRGIRLANLFKGENTFLLSLDNLIKTLNRRVFLDKMTGSDCASYLYLGRGFAIRPRHTSALHALMAEGLSVRASVHNGSPEIQRIDKSENLFMNTRNLEGHTLMFGAPGSGKTRFFELLIVEAILREEVVIVIDPKGDHDLKNSIEKICHYKGRELRVVDNRILKNNSAPFNLLANISSPLDAADRLKALLEDKDSVFSDYAYQALIATAYTIRILNRNYTFENFKHYFDLKEFTHAFYEQCVFLCLKSRDPKVITYLQKVFKAQKIPLASYPKLCKELELLGSKKDKDEDADDSSKDSSSSRKKSLTALGGVLDYLLKNHPEFYDDIRDLETLKAVLSYDEEFFKKTTSSITPKLETLANTYLNEYFSPQRADAKTVGSVIADHEVLYVALNSLADNTLSRLMGGMLLKELESIAADYYALNEKPRHAISIFIDEAYETVGSAMLQLLNKGRGAGFNLTLATQTLGDFKTDGKKDYRSQILGNCNNLISLRVRDEETATAICAGMPTTTLKQQSVNLNLKGHALSDYDDTLGYGEHTCEVPLFPKALLGSLPNFEYLARLNDGRLLKGVIPLLNYSK